jgi:glyoxylase-like metal-dependent hydrolase (beta-lactamase superfamily II)
MRFDFRPARRAGVMVAAAVVTGRALAVAGRAVAQQQNFDNVQIDTVKVRDNVYMLVGAGGNTTVFTGDEGIMVVDTQFAPLSTKILAAIRAISQAPIRYVVSTHMHGDHIGGNEAISKAGRTRAGGNVVGDLAPARPARRDHRARERAQPAERAAAAGQQPCRSAVADRDLLRQEARVPVQRRGGADHPRAEGAHRRRQRGVLPQERRVATGDSSRR